MAQPFPWRLCCPATTLATADVRRPTPVPVGVLGRELGARPGWWLVRGWCEVGRGCMCVLVVCVCVLMREHPTQKLVPSPWL